MFELKPLRKESVPAALEKAKHYRLLNEPVQAESICLDVLEVEPDNQAALVTLLLALTDQFERELKKPFKRAQEVIPRLHDEYQKSYYLGIICERRALAHFIRHVPGSNHVAYEWFVQAMEHYETAAASTPSGIDDAVLRWNTCARIISRHHELKPDAAGTMPRMLE